MARKRKRCVTPFPTFCEEIPRKYNVRAPTPKPMPGACNTGIRRRTRCQRARPNARPREWVPAFAGTAVDDALHGTLDGAYSLCNWRLSDSTSSDSETSLVTSASILRTACNTVV
jgi:hypothetical protein